MTLIIFYGYYIFHLWAVPPGYSGSCSIVIKNPVSSLQISSSNTTLIGLENNFRSVSFYYYLISSVFFHPFLELAWCDAVFLFESYSEGF